MSLIKFKDSRLAAFANMEKYIPAPMHNDLMYMGTTEDGIDQYKHYDTRKYINVDNSGQFYEYDGAGYTPIDRDAAIQRVLDL